MNKEMILQRQIEALQQMRLEELNAKFFELYGFECGNTNPKTLRARLSYRLQEIYYGGISDEAKAKLKEIADRDPLANHQGKDSSQIELIEGLRLSREWQGVIHEVVTLGNGKFEYKGNEYKSLSAIARKITGTRWNGKVFFKVK